jgi:signal transduction histidine kinase
VKAPLPLDEEERLAALHEYEILDTLPEQVFDDLTQLAAQICDVPMSVVSLVDTDRQWFKSKVGLDAEQTPRDVAFCAHAIHSSDLLVVPDAREDERFADNPLVTGAPDIRFYAGAPLVEPGGHELGTICVIDRVPRELTPAQREALVALSRQTVSQMELRKKLAQQSELNERLRVARIEAERANGTKSRFLAHMSHELRTPLNAIIGFSKILRKALPESIGSKQPLYCDRITDNGLHLLALVNNVLDLSRIEADQMEITPERFDLPVLLSEVTEQVESLVGQNGNTLTLSCDESLGSMTSDPMRVRQCLINLLSNACKFTTDGTIGLTAVKETRDGVSTVRFEVADTGQGMTPDDTARIFGEFYRAQQPAAGHQEGTGLGLAITQQLCRLLGGEITARSRLGVGTTFVIRLPLSVNTVASKADLTSAEAAVAVLEEG